MRIVILATLLAFPLFAQDSIMLTIDFDAETYESVEIYRQEHRVVFVDSQTIAEATNASPIVIRIDSPHGYETGDQVQVAGAEGNTNANGLWTITRIDESRLSLDGATGNGEYVAGSGTAEGGGVDQGRLRRAPREGSVEEMLEAIVLELVRSEVLEKIPTAAVRQKQRAVEAARAQLEEEKRRATKRRPRSERP